MALTPTGNELPQAMATSSLFGMRPVAEKPSACTDIREWFTPLPSVSDGRRIATAGDDETVKVWDTETGQELLTLPGVGSFVDSALTVIVLPQRVYFVNKNPAFGVTGVPDSTIVKVLDATPFPKRKTRGQRPSKVSHFASWDLRVTYVSYPTTP